MWTLLPARGDLVDLSVAPSVDGTPEQVCACCLECTPDVLVVAEPPRDRMPRDAVVAGDPVIARWTDRAGGLCSLPTVLVAPERPQSQPSWWLRAAGDLRREPRRRYVREHVDGSALVVLAGCGPADRIAGDIIDLSEGGILLAVSRGTGIAVGAPAQVTAELADGFIALPARVVRISASDHGWQLALAFPDRHDQMDRIRHIVFAAARRRLRNRVETA